MTPKEKAKDLVYKMDIDSGSWCMDTIQCVACSIVSVNDTLEQLRGLDVYDYIVSEKLTGKIMYYEEVLKELEKL